MDDGRPLSGQFHVLEDGNTLVLRRRTGSPGAGLFLVLWLSGWTLGCVLMSRELIRHPSLQGALFALPFLAAWIFGSYALLGSFLGFERLTIGAEGVEHRSLFARRFVPLDDVIGVAQDLKVVPGGRGRSETTQPVLKIVLAGRPIYLGQAVGDEELNWLSGLIQKQLQSLIPERVVEHRLKNDLDPKPRIEVLSPGKSVPRRPSDSSIEQVDDWDGARFVRRGRVTFKELAGITLLCMFWNGSLGIFALQLVGHFQWFLFLFLIPHEIIGLRIFAGFLATLCGPFQTEQWVVGSSEVSARFSFLGLGRTRTWDRFEIGHIELRAGLGKKNRLPITTAADEAGCSLALVSQAGDDLLRIDRLTEGEARWLGVAFCSLLKGSLKEPDLAPQPVESLYDRWLDA